MITRHSFSHCLSSHRVVRQHGIHAGSRHGKLNRHSRSWYTTSNRKQLPYFHKDIDSLPSDVLSRCGKKRACNNTSALARPPLITAGRGRCLESHLNCLQLIPCYNWYLAACSPSHIEKDNSVLIALKCVHTSRNTRCNPLAYGIPLRHSFEERSGKRSSAYSLGRQRQNYFPPYRLSRR